MANSEDTFVFQSLLRDEAAWIIPFFSTNSSYNSFPFFISMRSRGVQRTATRTNFRIPFLARMLLNRLAPKVPNNIFKNPSFCSFVFFLIVLVTPFNKILDLQESEQFSLCHSFLYLKLLKLLSQNRVFSFEFLDQLLK